MASGALIDLTYAKFEPQKFKNQTMNVVIHVTFFDFREKSSQQSFTHLEIRLHRQDLIDLSVSLVLSLPLNVKRLRVLL